MQSSYLRRENKEFSLKLVYNARGNFKEREIYETYEIC